MVVVIAYGEGFVFFLDVINQYKRTVNMRAAEVLKRKMEWLSYLWVLLELFDFFVYRH